MVRNLSNSTGTIAHPFNQLAPSCSITRPVGSSHRRHRHLPARSECKMGSHTKTSQARKAVDELWNVAAFQSSSMRMLILLGGHKAG